MTTRRNFLIAGSAALAGPAILRSSVLADDKTPPPSERVTMGFIGVGGQGSGNLGAFLNDPRVQVVAICDVDKNHLARGLEMAKLPPEAGYGDWRELIARDDIDAVMIATPDHWHAIITTAAARAGKDIYCEKPLASSIGEGRHVSNVIKETKRVLQCGTWRRSSIHTRMGCEWVRNGYVGTLGKIEVAVPGVFGIQGDYTGSEPATEPPVELDYAMWQGPSKPLPYRAGSVHFNFRWVNQYAPGYITDWGAHFLDVAQWGNGTDDTAPIEVEAADVKSRSNSYYDAPEQFRIDYKYANGVKMTMISTDNAELWGTKFIGSEGSVFSENTKLITEPKSLRTVKLKDSDLKLYDSPQHHRNFIDCVLSRKLETAATAEAAHRAATCCHIAAIAATLKRPLKFDPIAETFDDPAANAYLMPKMNGGWKLS
ncbi:MAG: Gfo/Idh/MocA family oxidoreductase [Verrucomicrobiae bacterium]|nr:Gfo/Idh/MocA family oxidoreductase [Verrucomicrobiae bacterium]